MSGEKSRERRVAHFRGHVQGVGFRYTTQRIAGNFAVDGYVRNLPNGEVLLMAEGKAAELDAFLDQIKTEMGHHIRTADIAISPSSDEFHGFEIRY